MTAGFERAALPLDGMVVTGERGARVRCAYGRGIRAFSIVRRDLDAALLDAAVAAGARVEDGVLVRGPLVDAALRVRGVIIAGRDGRDVRVPAPLVIAADGRRSRIALPLGLVRQPRRPRRWAIGAYFNDVDGVGAFGEMHVRRGRYVGVAPVPGGLTNVCLVVSGREASGDPATLLREAIAAEPMFRERFARARMVESPVVLGPLAVDAHAAGTAGLLLAGDAAGFIDPMTGDGLHFALRGGELAAHAALSALEEGRADAYVQLERMRRQAFRSKWRFNRALRALAGSPLAMRVASRGADWAPGWVEQTIRYAGDA
jgi:flavin-dependent dehydrogenase